MSHQSDLPPHVPSCVSTGAGVTVPDATATPRTDALIFAPNGNYFSASAADYRDLCRTLERELTAAKAEIARLNSHEGDLVIGCAIVEGARRQEARAVDRLEADSAALRAEVEQLRAQLRERTQWQCKCGGTDCAGMAENERLKQAVDFWIAKEALMEVERDQLRDRVAELEQSLADCATKAAAEYGEQLKPLFAKVRELEQRLTWARKNCRVIYHPPDNAYPVEHAPHANKDQWEALAVYADQDAARAGKGAT